MRDRLVRSILLALVLAASSSALLAVTAARCLAVTPGYRESFPGTSTAFWAGGAVYSNPGTGGVGGSGDGFLVITRPTTGNLGGYSEQPPYVGDWLAAGITAVNLWLNDVNTPQSLEIHFSLGDPSGFPQNFWQYNVGFIPPAGRWQSFTVVLDSTQFTHIIGVGSFAGALQNVTKVHIRNDKPPFQQTPDAMAGDFGVDDIFLIAPGQAGVDRDPAAVRAVQLSPPVPNPSRGPVALTLRTYDDSPVTLEIVDVSGRTIRHARMAGASAGPRTWTWDGRDDRGVMTAPGNYRARAFSTAGGTSIPVVRIR